MVKMYVSYSPSLPDSRSLPFSLLRVSFLVHFCLTCVYLIVKALFVMNYDYNCNTLKIVLLKVVLNSIVRRLIFFAVLFSGV